MRRIINREGSTPSIVVYLLILLLLPLFLYEGYLLQQTAAQIEVEGVSVEDYTTEIEDGVTTKIEMDINIDIRNHAPRNVKIERLEYDLMIEPEDFELEDIELDSGELHNEIIYGGSLTTISLPIENEEEEDIEKIQDYIMEEEGEVEAVAEIHVPLLQLVIDYPITTVSEQLVESFGYEPILESYEIGDEVEEENITVEENGPDSDYDLIVPYNIETNDNEFFSDDIEIEVIMTDDDENIEGKDTIELEIGKPEKGNLIFGLDEEETEDIFTEEQTFTFTPEIKLEDFTFKHDPYVVDSPATLSKYEIGDDVEGENVTIVKDEEDSDQLLKIPYNFETEESDYFEGDAEIVVTMADDDENIEGRDTTELTIGENKKGNFTFSLDENETEDIFTEDQIFTFTPEIKLEHFTFQHDPYEVDSPAVLEEYEVDSENSTLEEAGEDFDSEYVLKTPYQIQTNENDLISGEVEIIATMTELTDSDGPEIGSTDTINFNVGEDPEGNISFELDEDDIEELLTEDQTIEFYSDITYEEEDISFEREHESVDSKAMIVEYKIYGDDAELDEDEEHMEIPYYIETQETAFFEDGGNILVNTTMVSEDGNVSSSTSFDIEIGETKQEMLEFELDDDEIKELREDDKTFTFTSDVERNDVTFEYDHEEEGEWIAPN